jgi:bacterioferritin-associated ferredoxin
LSQKSAYGCGKLARRLVFLQTLKELLEQQPCQHDAVAATNLELLPIGRERLNHLLGSEETAGSLQALMAVPGLGRVYRSRSRCNGELEVISEYSDLPGGAVRVRQIPARRRIEASRPFASDSQLECCAAPDRRNQLLLEPESGRLVGLALDQGWPQLDELISLLLRDQPLTPLQQQAFAASGQLLLEAPEQRVEPASDLVCPCTGTTGIRLRELSCQGASLEDLKRLTAAGTVCGGCLCRLPLFLKSSLKNPAPSAKIGQLPMR